MFLKKGYNRLKMTKGKRNKRLVEDSGLEIKSQKSGSWSCDLTAAHPAQISAASCFHGDTICP